MSIMLVRRPKNKDDCVTLAPGVDFRPKPVIDRGKEIADESWKQLREEEERRCLR